MCVQVDWMETLDVGLCLDRMENRIRTVRRVDQAWPDVASEKIGSKRFHALIEGSVVLLHNIVVEIRDTSTQTDPADDAERIAFQMVRELLGLVSRS